MRSNLLLLALLLPLAAQAQVEEGYTKETTFGINFNTNGGALGGVDLRIARVAGPKTLRVFSLQLAEIKHPKEVRYQSFATGSTFIFGKQNYVFTLRPGFGFERLLFRKYPEEGVKLNWTFHGGLSLGFLKPYYVEYDFASTTATTPDIRSVAFDPETMDPFQVRGTGGFFRGLGEIQLEPGFHVRTGLMFEYGQFDRSVTAIEAGAQLEAFQNEIIIIPYSQNRSVFTSAYIILHFGSRKP